MCRNIFTKSFRKCAFFVCAPSATRFDTFWDDFTYCWLSVCYISHTMYMRQEYTSPDCAERSRRVYQIISHTLPNHSPRCPKSSGRGSRTVSYIQSCHSVSLVNSSQTIKIPLPHQEATVSQMLKNYVYLYKRYFFWYTHFILQPFLNDTWYLSVYLSPAILHQNETLQRKTL